MRDTELPTQVRGTEELREEFLAAFRDAHGTLHRLWTAAVGTAGYDKAAWRALDNALSRFARDAAEKYGITRSEPLL